MTVSPEPRSEKIKWQQPLGLWRDRGASATALRLGMGLPPMAKEKPQSPDIDNEGFSLWHYWAESPRPADVWTSALSKLSHDQRNHRSNSGEHPWHRLALRGQLEAMRIWSSHFETPFSETHDDAGLARHDSLAARAAWSGNNELVMWLLQLGVNIHSVDENGHTPLMIAIHRCNFHTVQALIHHGADPDAVDERGRTAMHHAAQCDQADIYAMIEDCGGEASKKDLQGQTALAILGKTTHTPQQANIIEAHWNLRYQSKLAF